MHVCGIADFDSSTAVSEGNINRATTFKHFTVIDGDGACTDGTRRDNSNRLAATGSIDSGLDCCYCT